MSAKKLEYEAFLPHHAESKHRVMAVIGFPGHPQLRALATVSEAITARRLADALNSRLLGRRNHAERLDAALATLPDSVVAAVRQLPIDPNETRRLRPRLASHLFTTPIDGVLTFRTTACTTEECAACNDCANDCRACTVCETTFCEACIPPELTPRTAMCLATVGKLFADQLYDLAEQMDAGRTDNEYLLDGLPRLMHSQKKKFVRRMARAYDDLADDLLNGDEPRPRDLAEQVALDLILSQAEGLYEDLTIEDSLPECPYDYDFGALYEVLFEDMDHQGLLSPQHKPAEPGELKFLFEPFYSEEGRDPERGFRR